MICKNCGHEVFKRDTGWWVHIRPTKTRLGTKRVRIIDVECSCGCVKPEPRNQVPKNE